MYHVKYRILCTETFILLDLRWWGSRNISKAKYWHKERILIEAKQNIDILRVMKPDKLHQYVAMRKLINDNVIHSNVVIVYLNELMFAYEAKYFPLELS